MDSYLSILAGELKEKELREALKNLICTGYNYCACKEDFMQNKLASYMLSGKLRVTTYYAPPWLND